MKCNLIFLLPVYYQYLNVELEAKNKNQAKPTHQVVSFDLLTLVKQVKKKYYFF